MDAVDLYWILKLDDIRETLSYSSVFLGFSLFGIFACLVGFIIINYEMMSSYNSTEEKERLKVVWGAMKKVINTAIGVVVVSIFLLLVSTFLPSTKQMATAIVLPKIATEENIEALTGEAKEIYELAKAGLKNAINKNETKDNNGNA